MLTGQVLNVRNLFWEDYISACNEILKHILFNIWFIIADKYPIYHFSKIGKWCQKVCIHFKLCLIIKCWTWSSDLVDEAIVSNMPFCVWRGICVQPAWFEKDQNWFFTLHSIICSHPGLLFCNWRWPQLFFPMLQEREHRRGWTKY